MTLLFVGYAAFAPNVRHLRSTSPVDGAYCLLAGIGLCTLLSWARQRMSATDFRVLLLLALLAAGNEGIRDYRVFTSVVVRPALRR
jgi:hypothetical protein